MKNQELRKELVQKLLQITPLYNEKNYQTISTEDIIDSLNDLKESVQIMTGKNVLENLPNDVPRDEAILMSITLWKHIGNRISEEIENLK
jgi:hypothetical protein